MKAFNAENDKEFEIKNCQSSLFEGNILLEKKNIKENDFFDIYKIINNNYIKYTCI